MTKFYSEHEEWQWINKNFFGDKSIIGNILQNHETFKLEREWLI